MSSAPRVIAIIAAFNEEDIIGPCIAHLAAQGVESYLLDDGSTDRTIDAAQAMAGRGLIGLEQLSAPPNPVFSLKRILQRKEQLAAELAADWFINQDADEFRGSLWSELTLQQAFGRVSSFGYNAVDFAISTMLAADAVPAEDRDSEWWVPSDPCDRLQVRAWCAGGAPVAMVDNGGHDVTFAGRRVFPMRFPMRHCPIRSREHGERKVLQERLPRFDPAERAIGWHIQYEKPEHGPASASPAGAKRYDPTDARIRAALSNRDFEGAVRDRDAHAAEAHATRQLLDDERRQSADLRREAGLARERMEAEQRQLEDTRHQLQVARDDNQRLQATVEMTHRQAIDAAHKYDASLTALHRELAAMHESKSWRWTAWARKVADLFGRR